ncbi:MAG: hypothetical protein AAF293_00910 [Pseudomonadota bacterium]
MTTRVEIRAAREELRSLRDAVHARSRRARDAGRMDEAKRLFAIFRKFQQRLLALWAAEKKILTRPAHTRSLASEVEAGARRARKAVQQMSDVAQALTQVATLLSYVDRLVKVLARG